MVGFGPRIDVSRHTSPVQDVPSDRDCSICVKELEESACVSLDVCNHIFHSECLDTWLNSALYRSNICPDCRTIICERRQMLLVDADDTDD